MQNVGQSENRNIDKVNVQLDVVKSSTPQSSASSPAKSETETYSAAPAKYMTDSSESEDDSVSEAEMEEDGGAESSKFLLSHDDQERAVDPEMQARLEALLEAAGIGKLSGEGKHLADPEVLRRLTSSVSCALDEAAAALTRMRSDQPPAVHRHLAQDKPTQCGSTATGTTPTVPTSVGADGAPSLAEACSDGDVGTVRKLLTEGRSVHETTEEGESLLSLACSAGYYELAQVLLAMHASVEDRGIKGDCTPLMEAASAGHVDIVRLLIAHGADVNAVSGSGNTPLMYACAGGHEECVRALLESGANVEDHNENGHTPLMEAASAGHVGVADILLKHGAGINTHSNEFKESALTLACYKGHLDMVRFLLAAGADREHKTDEMHTALMEASMDGHVEVARLLLDSGAQVNMPTDSFESPLTLAACGGHVELALLLLERGANIEEVNDEGYTPLMEAAREGHEEMVGLLLSQGASINAQTEETQETALTLACCGGFLEVAMFLIKAGADVELGASTPLMEASQEGHLELVRYLLSVGADVHAQTQTGDTALTYACENGHTDVADLLLRAGAALEHESEGGRTPLMKACRAGHDCTVQFLVGKRADVNRMTANGDHTPLSLACAGGHVEVVKFLLACNADPFRKLKDNSSTLIEAAKGGHTAVVQLLLDYPHSVALPCAVSPAAPTPTEEALNAVEQAAAISFANAVANVVQSQDGRKKATPVNTTPPTPPAAFPAPSPALPATPAPSAASVAAAAPKHKSARKQRPAQPHSDHHLPPPPDIDEPYEAGKVPLPPGFTWKDICKKCKCCDDKFYRPETAGTRTRTRHDSLPETERSPLDAADVSGPPTLATSALQALDLQFCAQGVTTVHTPSTPPDPPPELLFPVQQLANLNQQQLQQLQQQQLEQQKQQQLAQDLQRPLAAGQQLMQSSDDVISAEARELGAVLAYLQREVPSLVALPPSELRALVVQVMQQKTNEIFGKREPTPANAVNVAIAPANVAATQTVAADQPEEWPRRLDPPGGNGCQYASPEPAPPHFAPPALPYSHKYRTRHIDFPPSTAAAPQPQPPPHSKPHHHATTATAKKKGRLAGHRARAPAEPAPPAAPAPAAYSAMDVDAETDSNRDTALTLACAGGHAELCDLLLCRGADIEHRDKKGFTPLILAATAGHDKIVEILLNHGADIEAQSERTKDTPLSLACSGGRYEVVELMLSRGANKEHRNVSDYTPLSLAASGGYVNIIRLLLHHQAEINSRTGSKLGISPLMLAAMNGHTAAVRLLLDCGSDINAQIETNRNTALTLACFQGRHEVVSLLLDRKANVEHRAKTGLTPLMEAASGGYVEVGRVLLDKGADVNAPPVPSSRDTALTIAADKGHTKFVELLLQRRAAVEVKNKKGNSPLWLAANGGHLGVVEMLHQAGADIDSQDNRKVSCLMAAFRKGHTKVVKWMVGVVTQFPSDQEMTRYICTISDKEMLEKCQECVRVIRAAKETQAARANANASILLEELDAERSREESRRLAAARRRERKKKKKLEKKVTLHEERRKLQAENDKNSLYSEKAMEECSEGGSEGTDEPPAKEEGDSGIDANSQGSCSSSDVKALPAQIAKPKKKKKDDPAVAAAVDIKLTDKLKPKPESKPDKEPAKVDKKEKENVAPLSPPATPAKPVSAPRSADKRERKPEEETPKSLSVPNISKYGNSSRKSQVFESTRLNVDKDDVDTANKKSHTYQWEADANKSTSPKGVSAGRREEGWKEVVRKSSVQTLSTVEPGCKKVSVGSHAISRVIGRAGTNINAIRTHTGAHIEVDKQGKGQGERIITIKGSAEATKQAAALIASMIRDPDADIAALLARRAAPHAPPKPHKQPPAKQQPPPTTTATVAPRGVAAAARTKPHAAPRHAAPRLATVHHAPAPPPAAPPAPPAPPAPGYSKCYPGAMLGRAQSFAAKLAAPDLKRPADQQPSASSPLPVVAPPSPLRARVDPPQQRHEVTQLSPDTTGASTWSEESAAPPAPPAPPAAAALHINTSSQCVSTSTQEYSLFKDVSRRAAPPAPLWPPAPAAPPDRTPPMVRHASRNVDASKAPGYRGGAGGACGASGAGGVSPCSRASSHGETPPPLQHAGNNVNTIDMSGMSRNGPIYQDNSRNGHNMMVSMAGTQLGNAAMGLGYVGVDHKQQQQAGVFSGGAAAGNLSSLLLSLQPQHHVYQSLLDRGVGVTTPAPAGWTEEEERKPRPIGTERLWKLNAPDDWQHTHLYNMERYQQMSMGHSHPAQMGRGVESPGAGPAGPAAGAYPGGSGAALSLMHSLQPQYAPWDPHQHHQQDKQTWSKWSH